jgi:peptide/nickel transport system permease protein
MKQRRKKGLYIRIIIVYIFVALLAPFLANEKPFYVSINGNHFFPALSNQTYYPVNGKMQLANSVNWKNLKCDAMISPFVRWSPLRSDIENILASPFEKQVKKSNGETVDLKLSERHFLGTGRLGNDTLADLIHGTRTSLLIGFLSMLIAVFTGVFLGGLAGYFGDTGLRVTRMSLLLSILLIIPAWFYGFYIRGEILRNSFNQSGYSVFFQMMFSIFIFMLIILIPFFFKSHKKKSTVHFPLDSLISRLIEIFLALPRLILILTLAALFHSSTATLITLIGLTSWTEIARVTRIKMLELKNQNFVEAARVAGLKPGRILIAHILPNIKDQIISIAIFVVASAIMIETGLSFLGIGVPAGIATWGQIMYEARQHYSAWWLVVSSGLAISGLLYSLFMLAQRGDSEKHEEKKFFMETILTNS